MAIAILQAVGYYFMMKRYGILAPGAEGIWPALVIIVSFIAGSSFVMWMGEQVTEFGVGNGISIILFAGIVSRVPTMVSSMVQGVSRWSAKNSGDMTLESLTQAGYTAEQKATLMTNVLVKRLGLGGAEFKTCRQHLTAPFRPQPQTEAEVA